MESEIPETKKKKEEQNMSSYWSAYFGDALVLNEEEFCSFQEKYLSENKMEEKDIILDYEKAFSVNEKTVKEMMAYLEEEEGEIRDLLSLCEIPFRNSSGDGFFSLVDILKDEYDGMFLSFHMDAGKPNVYISEKEAEKNGVQPHPVKTVNLRGENCYVLFADHDRIGPCAFGKSPYASYEELKKEFQDKIGRYLPEDFDWENHTGVFSYAAYA